MRSDCRSRGREFDHEIISTVILFLSAESFKKGCCQLLSYKRKYAHKVLVYRLRFFFWYSLSINGLFLFHKGSLIRPKVVRSVHYCPATKKTMERRYTDMTSLEAYPSSSAYPTKVSYVKKNFQDRWKDSIKFDAIKIAFWRNNL